MANVIQLKRGNEAQRTGFTPAAGEPIYILDENKMYIGDGSTAANLLSALGGDLTMANGSNNRVMTATSSSGLNGEANLTFDGSTLAVTGDATVSDDLGLVSDDAQLTFGANSEVKLIHKHNEGLILKHTATADDKPVSLILQTGETDIAADDVLGKLSFQAPDEGTGTDAILVAAEIAAVSEGDFSSSSNATSLHFRTGSSAAAADRMTLSSAGNLNVTGTITGTGTSVFADLDISGDVDVDGTLETDALTIGGTTLAETIADTAGAMFSSNTETGLSATYQDGDNTIDLAIAAAQTTITSLLATDIKIGGDDQTKIDFETADTINFYAGNEKQLILTDGALTPGADNILDLGSSSVEFKNAYFDGTVTSDAFAGPLTGAVTGNADTATEATNVTVSANNTTDETVYPVFVDGATGTQGIETDTGLTYNPSSGLLTTAALTVSGDTTVQNILAGTTSNTIQFEGSSDDANETTLGVIDPTGDRTINLPNVSGTLPVLAAASTTQISSTPEELNILDGATVVVGEINALDLGSTAVGNAIASKAVVLDSNKDYTGMRNFTVTGELDGATLDISGNADIDGTLEADAITINGTAIGSIYQVLAGSSDSVTTGALNSGSITSGFGTIDTGSSAITTTGLISGGSLDIDDVLINGSTIGHTDDTDLITVANGLVTVAGEISVTTLDIGGTNVSATAAELNILDGVTATATELNLIDGVTATTAELNILDGVTSTAAELNALDGITAVVGELNALDLGSTAVGTAIASKAVVLDSNKDYTGIRNFTITGTLDGATISGGTF